MRRSRSAFGTATLRVAVALGCASHSVPAQTLPLGGRTASMGGAGVAQGRDGAMPYVNPAGFARVPHTTISLSASLYRYERFEVAPYFFHGNLPPTLRLAVTPDRARDRLTSARFSSFPGAAAVLWHLGPEDQPEASQHVLSASILVSQNVNLATEGAYDLLLQSSSDPSAVSSLAIRRTDVRDYTDYLFGGGYSLRRGAFSFGIGTFFGYTLGTLSNSIEATSAAANVLNTLQTANYRDVWSLSFQPVAGVQWQPAPLLSLGASVALSSFPLTGTFRSQSRSERIDASGVQLTAGRAAGSYAARFPARFRAGVAWGRGQQWMLAADVVLEPGLSPGERTAVVETRTSTRQGEPAQTERRSQRGSFNSRSTLAWHLGGELFLTRTLAMRCGLYYEPSHADLTLSAGDQLLPQIDRFGLTLGGGLEDSIGETTLGIDLSAGRGKSIAPDPLVSAQSFERVNAADLNLQVFLAGAIDVGEFAKWLAVARDPGQILNPDTRLLRVSDLPASLAALDAPGAADLSRQRVEYIYVGEPAFDRFFERTARIRLAVQVAPLVLEHLRTQLQHARASWPRELVSALFIAAWASTRTSQPTPPPRALEASDGAPALLDSLRAARAFQQLMQGLLRDASSLPSDGAELVERARAAFSGPKLLLLPGVLRGLERSGEDLTQAVARLSELVEALDACIEELLAGLALTQGQPLSSSLPAPRSEHLRLSQLGLAALEGGPLDGVRGQVRYAVTGLPEVDAVLLGVAKLRGAALEAQLLVDQLAGVWRQVRSLWTGQGADPEALWKGLASAARTGRALLPAGLERLPQVNQAWNLLRAAHDLAAMADTALRENAERSELQRHLALALRELLEPAVAEGLLSELQRAEPARAREVMSQQLLRLQKELP
jgi:hypothetical protein